MPKQNGVYRKRLNHSLPAFYDSLRVLDGRVVDQWQYYVGANGGLLNADRAHVGQEFAVVNEQYGPYHKVAEER